MRPIPKKLRDQLALDPFMKNCIMPYCSGRPVEWNHAIIVGGRQSNQWYAIIPLCRYHHRGNSGTIFREAKERCTMLAIERSGGQIQTDYPKTDWQTELKYLKGKYGQ